MLRNIFGPKREEVKDTGQNIVFCVPRQMIFSFF